jgi:hypothetical protein
MSRGAAWEAAAAEQMAAFAPSFEIVATREPALAERYPSTAKYLGARSEVAKRAASTRKTKGEVEGEGGRSDCRLTARERDDSGEDAQLKRASSLPLPGCAITRVDRWRGPRAGD